MNLIQQFESVFKVSPTLQTISPGRVNLIGEHTDYNDGFVMPIAIQYVANILASPRDDQEIHVHSLDFQSASSFLVTKEIPFDTLNTWSNYQRGIVNQFIQRGDTIRGANLLVHGNVPIGAGLSSSAAIEMATAMAIKSMNQLDISIEEMAKLSQAAENQFVGMNCGIMDQFISGIGQEGMALFLDCRDLQYEQIPFPNYDYTIIIMNTKVKRELTGTKYNKRRLQCEEGVEILQKKMPHIQALRDISVSDFEQYKNLLPEVVQKRCQHVVYENERVMAFRDALIQKDIDKMGELFLQSHRDLQTLFEVSCPELDLMVDIAMDIRGVAGARMTGAGFGGCSIALVEKGREQAVENKIMDEYSIATGIEPEIYFSPPSDGTLLIEF